MRSRDVLAGADDTLAALDAALLDGHPPGLLDLLDGALHTSDGTAMRWAPPPGPGDVDPYEHPEKTQKFRDRVRDPGYRPPPPETIPERLVTVGPGFIYVHTNMASSRSVPHFRRPDLPGPLAHFTQADLRPRPPDLRARPFAPGGIILRPTDLNAPMARNLSTLGERITKAFQPLAKAVATITQAFGTIVDRLAPSRPPADARQRALYMRQHRNTGPDHGSFPHRGGFTSERVPGPRGQGRDRQRPPSQRR